MRLALQNKYRSGRFLRAEVKRLYIANFATECFKSVSEFAEEKLKQLDEFRKASQGTSERVRVSSTLRKRLKETSAAGN